jgi:hypothetical protein
MKTEFIGYQRFDYGFASITAMLYNINRPLHSPLKNPVDFMPFQKKGDEEPESTPLEFAKAFGAEVIG